jgi:YD repeat-containing protein
LLALYLVLGLSFFKILAARGFRSRVTTFGYDNLGRRTSLTRGNGTVTNYDHDANGRLETLGQDLAGTSADVTLGFGYNRAGQIASNTRSKDLYALIARPLGNVDYEAGGLNQLTKVGAAVPTHDGRGNMTSDGTKSYSYSTENLLTGGPGGSALDYDPAMRLYQTNATGVAPRKFGYDGTDLIAEFDSNNAITRRHVDGPGVDEPLVTYEGSDTATRRWLHADERGSIIASREAFPFYRLLDALGWRGKIERCE